MICTQRRGVFVWILCVFVCVLCYIHRGVGAVCCNTIGFYLFLMRISKNETGIVDGISVSRYEAAE